LEGVESTERRSNYSGFSERDDRLTIESPGRSQLHLRGSAAVTPTISKIAFLGCRGRHARYHDARSRRNNYDRVKFTIGLPVESAKKVTPSEQASPRIRRAKPEAKGDSERLALMTLAPTGGSRDKKSNHRPPPGGRGRELRRMPRRCRCHSLIHLIRGSL
jgi:hypothetical protein